MFQSTLTNKVFAKITGPITDSDRRYADGGEEARLTEVAPQAGTAEINNNASSFVRALCPEYYPDSVG